MGICPLPSFPCLRGKGSGESWPDRAQSWGSLAPAELLGFCVTGLREIYAVAMTSLLYVISGLIESYVQVVTVSYLCDGAPGSGAGVVNPGLRWLRAGLCTQ